MSLQEEKFFGIANKGMIIKDNKLLFIYKTLEEAQNDPDPKFRRDQPGGRLEFGENPVKSLEREIWEEVKLEVNVIEPLNVWNFVKGNFQLVGINYLCIWKSGEVVLSEEHESYEWLTEEELLKKDWGDIEQYLLVFKKMHTLTI